MICLTLFSAHIPSVPPNFLSSKKWELLGLCSCLLIFGDHFRDVKMETSMASYKKVEATDLSGTRWMIVRSMHLIKSGQNSPS